MNEEEKKILGIAGGCKAENDEKTTKEKTKFFWKGKDKIMKWYINNRC